MYHRSLGPCNTSDKQFLAYLCPIRWFRFIQTRAKIYNDHYETLELKTNASAGEIKEAYYKLSKLYHPDVYQEQGDTSSDKFKSISSAYEILRDPHKRSQYDIERRFKPRGMTGPGQVGPHHYPGNAEYRGGPRRNPTSGSTSSSSQDYDDWVNRNFGSRIHATKTNAKNAGEKGRPKQKPGYEYFWYFFWGTCVTWFTLTSFVLFNDKNNFGSVQEDLRSELRSSYRAREVKYLDMKKNDDVKKNVDD